MSDALVAYQMCEPAQFGGQCGYGQNLYSEHVEARRVFFSLAVVFICLNWSVLWYAVCRHFVLEYVVDVDRILGPLEAALDNTDKYPDRSIKWWAGWSGVFFLSFLLLCIIVLPNMVFGAVLLLPVCTWYGVKNFTSPNTSMQEIPCHGARQIQICSAGSHNFEGANTEADASVRSRTALDLTSPPWLRGEAARPVASSCMSTSCTRKPALARWASCCPVDRGLASPPAALPSTMYSVSANSPTNLREAQKEKG